MRLPASLSLPGFCEREDSCRPKSETAAGGSRQPSLEKEEVLG